MYYAKRHVKIKVINAKGVNAYQKKNLTGKRAHYRYGQQLKVKKIVSHNLTTRFVLSNGTYVTANKKLVMTVK
ncbi:Type IV pilus biogenesis protein PilO [Levilactobacillus brevis]|nr:Type IV pilus biogenesis protein PilO [Levilactobacillus brevis]